MQAIRAYPITGRVGSTRELTLPGGARLLSVGIRQGQLVAYALVDTAEAGPLGYQRRRVLTLGTGQPAPHDMDAWHFLGTAQTDDANDAAQVHVFYR